MAEIIYVTGPEPDFDEVEGTEYPTWYVQIIDDDSGDEKNYTKFYNYEDATEYAEATAIDLDLEIESDAMRA